MKADASAVREKLKDKQLEGWERQRLQAALLGLSNDKTYVEIAAEVGTSGRSVSTWLDLFRAGGIEGLLTRLAPGKGPQSWMDPQSQAALEAQLDQANWRRAQDARVWLEEKLGRKISLSTTYKYLGKAEARLKVPRPSHQKKDPEAVETFRTTLCAQLHAQKIPLDTTVHLWVLDEMRFGLQPVTRRVWTRGGIEPIAPVNPCYSYGYTFGALEVWGDGAEFLHTDGVSQEASLCFYEQIAASDPSAIHIIIQDGAGFHLHAAHPKLPERVRVITLPPYSPELNPIERLWDIIKDRICNRVWEDLTNLTGAINHVLKEYWATPSKVRSLIGNGYLCLQVNTTSLSVLAA